MSVIVLRGISGAGKTTWVRKFKETIGTAMVLVFSADDFFTDAAGEYHFNPKLLSKAHAKCLREFADAVKKYWNKDAHLIVDNTNTSLVEIAPYMALAQAYEHDARVVTIIGNVDECAARNLHEVPRETIQKQYNKLGEEGQRLPPWWKHDVVFKDMSLEAAKETTSSR